MSWEFNIFVSIWVVSEEEDKVEPGEEGGREIDVLVDALIAVVSAVERVGCC